MTETSKRLVSQSLPERQEQATSFLTSTIVLILNTCKKIFCYRIISLVIFSDQVILEFFVI